MPGSPHTQPRPGWSLSSFPGILDIIIQHADDNTRLVLLRTTYQLHRLAGPRIYHEVTLSTKTIGWVFLGYDIADDGPDLVKVEGCDGAGKDTSTDSSVEASASGRDQPHALPAPAQKKKTSASWAKDYHPVRKFKASLLGHIRVLIITEHPSTFCKRICSSASLLSKVEVVQFLCPRINYQQSVTDFCESSDGCCPLIKQLDVRKVVVRNLKSSGLPRELLGEAEWHPPSLKQVTLVLPDNGSMSRVEHDLPVHLQLGGLLPNCPDLKLKVLFLEDVPTPCDRKFSKGPPWFDRQKEFPLFVSQLVEILVPDTIHVRPLSIYGVDDLRFDHSFYWSDGEQEHYRAQARKHIEETYNKKPPPATGGSKSGLLFGSMEAYWDTDITGERTLRERELRESSLKGRREREAVKNSWLAKREGLKAKFTSGDWPKPPTDEELEEKHGRDRRRWPRDKHWRIEYAEVGDFDKDQYPTWFDLAEGHALGFDKY